MLFNCVLERCFSINGTVSPSHMMWCWCCFPSFWLGGRHGSLTLEWWGDSSQFQLTRFVLTPPRMQIPLETKAKEIWGAAPQRQDYLEDERTPLLAGGGEGGMLARYSLWKDFWKSQRKFSEESADVYFVPKYNSYRYVEGSTLYEGSVRNFYSPFESPDASDDDEEVGKTVRHV